MTTPSPAAPSLILCATRRLARSLQLGTPAASGQLPTAFTIADWLDRVFDEALLRGELPLAGAGVHVLSALPERLVWRQVIARALGKESAAALFDLDGLAKAAQEAHALMETWGLSAAAVQSGGHDEAARFLQWRFAFLRFCDGKGWRDAARHRVWQVEQLAAGIGALPGDIALAGFDRFNPGEQKLLAALAKRGVAVGDWRLGGSSSARVDTVSFADAEAEYRALAEWLRLQLAANPMVRLGVVVPDLAGARPLLTRLLDEAIAPEAFMASHAQAPRSYNVSLGQALGRVPPVEVALNLLRLAGSVRRVEQATLGALLLAPYWSAESSEADARALLDAESRKRLPAVLSLDRWLRFAETRLGKGWGNGTENEPEGAAEDRVEERSRSGTDSGTDREIDSGPSRGTDHNSTRQRVGGRTVAHLDALRKAATVAGKGKRPPGDWAEQFRRLLRLAGWPGERALSSHDFQAREAFFGVLDGLADFDPIVGEQHFGEALALLSDACGEVLFQPRTEGAPAVQVLGLLEAAGESFDALWVSGMLAGAWPPPARPNPLLPAVLQRAVGTPNASPEVQLQFASGVHQRFLQAAPELVFSWPRRDGERELQASPLLDQDADQSTDQSADHRAKERADTSAVIATAARLVVLPSAIEAARRAAGQALESLPDALAPVVADLDAARHLKGGTALLKAQAICPASAFYQFRLGALALESPVDGLDPRARGSLLHLVFEHFWRGRASAELRAWSPQERSAAIDRAVADGLREFEQGSGEGSHGGGAGALPARFRRIEVARLQRLLGAWVEIELTRSEDFRVIACEEKHPLCLDGIEATVVIDRIDQLGDHANDVGKRLVIDYKTGSKVDARSWAAARITEPQLPIYAAFAVNPHPLAGAAFAQVRSDRMGFVGITEAAEVLPKVKGLEQARKRFPESDFPDWASLIEHWRRALLLIAGEIRAGDARVVFADERALENSPVLPLLRLAERRWLYERGVAGTRQEDGEGTGGRRWTGDGNSSPTSAPLNASPAGATPGDPEGSSRDPHGDPA